MRLPWVFISLLLCVLSASVFAGLTVKFNIDQAIHETLHHAGPVFVSSLPSALNSASSGVKASSLPAASVPSPFTKPQLPSQSPSPSPASRSHPQSPPQKQTPSASPQSPISWWSESIPFVFPDVVYPGFDPSQVENHFIVATPAIEDGLFSKSVILMTQHSARNGSVGFIVNKPLMSSNRDSVRYLGLSPNSQTWVGVGGPIQPNVAHVLHDDKSIHNAKAATSDGLFLDGDNSISLAYSSPLSQRGRLLLVGFSGWAPNQLKHEAKRGSWVICPASKHDLLDTRPEDLFDLLVKRCSPLQNAWQSQRIPSSRTHAPKENAS
eukprot:TRINITY_DN10395_c0_g1_i1.p1 TRINITY_DN10395_c0_g1~~TRINITY_DN10395_c0_g1_i1.p1  ORF type:complete len:323 (+),score=24.63 TRINITY_DN10395_c0_g1_i1:31-999(+)